MADSLARLLLAGALLGDGTTAESEVRRVGVLIVEGVPDYLYWGTRFGDAAGSAPAILGVISGSWNDSIAAHIPDGTRVAVRTHLDPAGERYAASIIPTRTGTENWWWLTGRGNRPISADGPDSYSSARLATLDRPTLLPQFPGAGGLP